MPQTLTALTPAKPGYKHTRLGWIREDWEVKQLGEITKVVDCQHRTPKYVERGIPVISPGTINWGPLDLDKPSKRVTHQDFESLMSHCEVDTGDLVMSRNQSLGVASYVNDAEPFVLGQDTVLIKMKYAISRFLFFLLQSEKCQNTIYKLAGGSTFSRINLKDIRKLFLILPSLPEQQKIAEILTTWDAAIIKTEALITQKQQLKKGLMQQLLTGKKRFAEFIKSYKTKSTKLGEIPEDWDDVILNDIPDKKVRWSITGGPFGSDLKSEDYTTEGVRIIQLQNLGDGSFIDNNKIYTSETKANALLACNIYPGEIIISKMGDPVARACKIPRIAERFLMASDGIRLVPNSDDFDTDFVLFFINFRIFRKFAISHSTGSTRRRIGLSDLKNLPFLKPSLLEQQKIATVLSAADAEIESLQQQLVQLKAQKKGLMQRLLTGQVRVKLS